MFTLLPAYLSLRGKWDSVLVEGKSVIDRLYGTVSWPVQLEDIALWETRNDVRVYGPGVAAASNDN